MIPRLAIEHLQNWKANPHRKPLILSGARQVGKTTLVEEFSSQFDNYLYFNLEAPADLAIFERLADIDKLVQGLFLERGLALNTENTLIFIDEVQESHRALLQLPEFYEKYPALHVIAAGSLVEHALGEISSLSEDSVEFYALHPISFHEYLLGIGQMGILAAYLETPVPGYAHQRLMTVFNDYAIIGGMPEIADSFLEYSDYTRLAEIYDRLWATYRDDILKYARNSTAVAVLRHVLQSAPSHADKRIKFERFGNSSFKSREVAAALRSLEFAQVISLIYPTTCTEIPCPANFKKSPRLQLLDTGLVNHSLGLQQSLLGRQDLTLEYDGHIIQHMTSQELIARHSSLTYMPNFWVRQEAGSKAEVNLVYPLEDLLIPIEVKPGKPGRLRSLHQFMDHCPHTFAIRLYGGEFEVQSVSTIAGKDFKLLNLPYYLSGRIPEYAAWLVNSGQ